MTLAIILSSGQQWFTNEYESLESLKEALVSDRPIKCWYYMTHGQRVTEILIFKEDSIVLLRTESDD